MKKIDSYSVYFSDIMKRVLMDVKQDLPVDLHNVSEIFTTFYTNINNNIFSIEEELTDEQVITKINEELFKIFDDTKSEYIKKLFFGIGLISCYTGFLSSFEKEVEKVENENIQ